MEKQILEILTEMRKDMTSVKSELGDLRSEMHSRFDAVDAKLEGVGSQFELAAETRIKETDFLTDKVNKLEKEVYYLKNK
ncbi:hypothetical protein [Evansella clarkii]|uniref:hypothetical protein n=1 Tax=Evansella clarkii TaxID=79879 RepID=UPI0009966E34|nr:hypothetical protein [Evansella clarkii]